MTKFFSCFSRHGISSGFSLFLFFLSAVWSWDSLAKDKVLVVYNSRGGLNVTAPPPYDFLGHLIGVKLPRRERVS